MDELDLSTLRQRIAEASPARGPGRIVKLDRAYAQQILEAIEALKRDISILRDPNAVHIAMLRGEIAKPSVSQIVHIYGREALATELAGDADGVAALAQAASAACAASRADGAKPDPAATSVAAAQNQGPACPRRCAPGEKGNRS